MYVIRWKDRDEYLRSGIDKYTFYLTKVAVMERLNELKNPEQFEVVEVEIKEVK